MIAGLEQAGFRCTHIAQEHSYVAYMWQRIAKPDYLVFLNASYESCTKRRNLKWLKGDYAEELRRLAHAREHADLVVDTDERTPAEVLRDALEFLQRRV